MGGEEIRHPVITDSDALISVASTSLWSCVEENMNLTTTNVCIKELERHVDTKSEYAPTGSREKWVHDGSKTALGPFQDETNDSFTIATSVPRPHGRDAGETSVKQEVQQYPGNYTYAVLMDSNGRDAINRVFEEQDAYGVAVAPPYLLYLLHKNGCCSKADFCTVCGELLQGEGWTSYEAIQAVWEEIPIDCSDYLEDNLLP